MAQQTAINWLRKKLEETYDKEGKLPLAYTFSLLNKAEQMETEKRKEDYKIGYNQGYLDALGSSDTSRRKTVLAMTPQLPLQNNTQNK